MRKSWLALIFGLSIFALLGADCDTGGNIDDDKGPLPPRALAATPLLRTYYQTQYIPKEMKAIKIPEGDAFDPDELTLLFDMSGDEVVSDVRLRVTVGKPNLTDTQDPDLFARIIAPDGTTSGWKEVPLATDSQYIIVPEISFEYEFDNITSTGVWKVQLRDPIKDNDGRMLFRNATLRINNGEISTLSGQPFGSESVLLTSSNGKFGQLPELKASGFTADFGFFGVQNMLINNFTFTESFSVQAITLDFTVSEQLPGADIAASLYVLIIAPSGGYYMFPVGTATDSDTDLGLFYFHFDGGASNIVNGFPFWGEPSNGTWSVCIADLSADGLLYNLETNAGGLERAQPDPLPPIPAPTGIRLALGGQIYP